MQLVPQSYGIAMAQCIYGGPRGIWLECTACPRSERIKGATVDISDADAAKVFRKGGWTGRTSRMLRARCPQCTASHPNRGEL
jgi:hypothetical protein